eukprot:CAMPEP_0202898112 /NCGR_PEP_ID=MMETSP1392-20130828/6720_1 /ASSEMBLY_ACC=CAM_ASM_000868 /TAXON_ID=225041 /ORGANISM="Chlamydomonas chlamydogama, Strain SAG 11-48b" /LENGTH=62 /DNA_ID=CAMNT_0049583957 /DNA_START=560 /DNA_END=748 /DNA_ORIENTATION=+
MMPLHWCSNSTDHADFGNVQMVICRDDVHSQAADPEAHTRGVQLPGSCHDSLCWDMGPADLS